MKAAAANRNNIAKAIEKDASIVEAQDLQDPKVHQSRVITLGETMQNFADRIKDIKRNANEEILKGAVVEPYYGSNKATVLQLLNEALATEIVCVLRYKSHYRLARGLNSIGVAEEFSEHAEQEEEHAEKLACRIIQLGGKPDYNPEGLHERSHTVFSQGENLIEMLKEDIVAERIVIGIYQELIRYLGENDPTTRNIIETILAEEEEHAENLACLLYDDTRQSKEKPVSPFQALDKVI